MEYLFFENMTKYEKYQDYVFTEKGEFIGEFDKMYQDFDDPWYLTSDYERSSPYRLLTLEWIEKLQKEKNDLRIIDMGCGLGHFANRLRKYTSNVLGIDVAATAIKKAKEQYPDCEYVQGDILDFENIEKFHPDVLILHECTWYVLPKLKRFLAYMKEHFPNIYLIQLLVTYPPGVQKNGPEYFTDIDGILKFFDLDYLDSKVFPDKLENHKRTFFIGKFKKS